MFSFVMIIHLMNRTIIGLALFLIGTACSRRPLPPQIDSGLAIAQIDQKILTDKDLQNSIAIIKKKFPREFEAHKEKRSLVDQLIHLELLAEAAQAAGLEKDIEFKSRLADLYVEKLSEKARSSIGEKELLSFYKKNAASIDQIAARHILMKPQDRQKLAEIRAELIKDPDRFASLAQAHSTDSSASRGGDLGYFTFGMMVEPFSRAAFALQKPGDISPLVETEFGFHLIQLVGDKRGFEANKKMIEAVLLKERQSGVLQAELQRLRQKRDIKIYEENLIKISPLPEIIHQDPSETMKFNAPLQAQ